LCFAEAVSKPLAPDFSVKYVGDSYDILTTKKFINKIRNRFDYLDQLFLA
jgi:hypothetical protein